MKYKILFLIYLSFLGCNLSAAIEPSLQVAGQLALVALPDISNEEAFENLVVWLNRCSVGNMIVSKDHLGSGQVDEMGKRINCLAQAVLQRSGIPPLIACDQEGGRVQRILGTPIPPPMDIREEEIEKYASILADETKRAGVNLCLGPVLDVPCDGCFIGNRAFAQDPDSVISRANVWITVLKAHGILITGKHFPGHGGTKANTHHDQSVVDKSMDELIHWDMRPFIALMPVLDAIMSSHLSYPAVDDTNIATYSSTIMTDCLADYQGLRISDSLSMLAATPNQGSFEEAAAAIASNAVKAINAGCDLVILGKPEFGAFRPDSSEQMRFIDEVIARIAAAIDRGDVPAERLEDALGRIRRAKSKC